MRELTIPNSLESVVVADKPGIKLGIEEVLDAVDFSVSFANAIVLSYADGQLSLSDFGYAVAPFMKIPTVLTGINAIPAELSDLDEAELEQIITKVQNDLQIDDKKARNIVVKALRFAYATYDLVRAFKVESQPAVNGGN